MTVPANQKSNMLSVRIFASGVGPGYLYPLSLYQTKSFAKDRIPLALGRWQMAPRTSSAQLPQDSVHKQTVIRASAALVTLRAGQVRLQTKQNFIA